MANNRKTSYAESILENQHHLIISKLKSIILLIELLVRKKKNYPSIHSSPPSYWKIQSSLKYVCLNCNCTYNSSTPHDHFITCETFKEIKLKRLKSIETELTKYSLKSFYNNAHMQKINPEQIERCEISSSIESPH